MSRIPLRNRNGDVVAHAVVSVIDYERLSAYRWHCSSDGYVQRTAWIGGRDVTIKMSRQIMGLVSGDGLEVDHFNGNKLDNRRSNLRVSTHQQNCQNLLKRRGTSKYRNVYWNKKSGKWKAEIQVLGKKIGLGYFDDEDEAGNAAALGRAEHMPWSAS